MGAGIRSMKAALAERRAAHARLGQRLLQFMVRNDLDTLRTPVGTFRAAVVTRRAPVTSARVRDGIARFFGSVAPDTGLRLTDALFNGRERTEAVRLRAPRLPP